MFSLCKHYFFQKFFCKEGAHCTSCYVAVGFFVVLQNRTIGFKIKKLIVLGLFDPCISRKEQRSVGTLPNKGNNNGTVLQGAFKRENPQKTDKTDKKLNHLRFQLTEQLKNNTFLT